MKNPNAPINRIKSALKARWSEPDHPAAEPRFQAILFAKDILVFVFLPALAVLLVKSCDVPTPANSMNKADSKKVLVDSDDKSIGSQIIDFTGKVSSKFPNLHLSKRAPGTLVKVRLQNQVETFGNAPVHAVVVDNSLGNNMRGATLIGEASPEETFQRITVTFNLIRPPGKLGVALPISARGLSLSGTLGVDARKKEGFFARAALGSAQSASGKGLSGNSDKESLKDVLLQVFASGLINETNKTAGMENNRANVLVLDSSSTFYAELTDFFPEDRN